jgi:uncharacterized protein
MLNNILIKAVYLYQKIISPYLGGNCRFYPSCSEYAILSLQKYGVLKAAAKISLRLLRCNPISRGGIDYP